jgi:hypothetical protein
MCTNDWVKSDRRVESMARIFLIKGAGILVGSRSRLRSAQIHNNILVSRDRNLLCRGMPFYGAKLWKRGCVLYVAAESGGRDIYNSISPERGIAIVFRRRFDELIQFILDEPISGGGCCRAARKAHDKPQSPRFGGRRWKKSKTHARTNP